MGAFGNANFLANPTAYTFVLVCSCLNALTLVFASFKLHRYSPYISPISPLYILYLPYISSSSSPPSACTC